MEALEEAFAKYKAKITKTNPAIVKWIDKEMLPDLKTCKGELKLDIGSLYHDKECRHLGLFRVTGVKGGST